MIHPTKLTDPKLDSLLSLFPGEVFSPDLFTVVDGPLVPEPYKSLLVHCHHMTVTLEEHHSSRVILKVLARRSIGDDYARRLILTAGAEEKPVLVGLMRFHLQHTKEEVRRAILEEGTPLGRILIENNVLRWIQPHLYMRVRLSDGLRSAFRAPAHVEHTYGRVAHIICHNSPAVELLEIVSPEEV